MSNTSTQPILRARGLVKRYGRVVAVNGADFDLMPGEILAVIGDNGAGKSSLIKMLAGAVEPDEGEIPDGRQAGAFPLAHRSAPSRYRDGVSEPGPLPRPLDCRQSVPRARNTRERSVGSADPQAGSSRDAAEARKHLSSLGLLTIQNINQPVETLSGGQRQGVAVARAAAFGSRVIIMDEPTAALGVKESRRVLELIVDVKRKGLPIVLISHNMPHVFEVSDRIHIMRLGRRIAVIDPKKYSMSDAVAIMTGAMAPPEDQKAA